MRLQGLEQLARRGFAVQLAPVLPTSHDSFLPAAARLSDASLQPSLAVRCSTGSTQLLDGAMLVVAQRQRPHEGLVRDGGRGIASSGRAIRDSATAVEPRGKRVELWQCQMVVRRRVDRNQRLLPRHLYVHAAHLVSPGTHRIPATAARCPPSESRAQREQSACRTSRTCREVVDPLQLVPTTHWHCR